MDLQETIVLRIKRERDEAIELLTTVGSRVPAKPLRFVHWGAREDLPPIDPRPNLAKISRTNSTNSQHKGHKIYTGSGHRCGVIPYSSVVWWIASRAEDGQLQGEERPPEVRCSRAW